MLSTTRFRGRFIKKKDLERREKLREAINKRWQERRNENLEKKREISDVYTESEVAPLKALGKTLRCQYCNIILILEHEKTQGLDSCMVRCHQCNKLVQVDTREFDLANQEVQNHIANKIHNTITNAVPGNLNAGIDSTENNKTPACIDIPTISYKIFKKDEHKGPTVKQKRKAAFIEKQLVLKKLEELRNQI